MQVPFNKIFKSQNNKLLPATFKKGVISAVHPSSWTADVYLVSNPQTILRGVPFASSVDVNSVMPGNRCRLDLFDETNPSDMVIAYTYGSGQPSAGATFKTGTALITPFGTVIAHGLGVIPDFVTYMKSSDASTQIPNNSVVVTGGLTGSVQDDTIIDVYQFTPADSTNIHLKSVNGNISVQWCAISF
jgi:hypothetical protein